MRVFEYRMMCAGKTTDERLVIAFPAIDDTHRWLVKHSPRTLSADGETLYLDDDRAMLSEDHASGRSRWVQDFPKAKRMTTMTTRRADPDEWDDGFGRDEI